MIESRDCLKNCLFGSYNQAFILISFSEAVFGLLTYNSDKNPFLFMQPIKHL